MSKTERKLRGIWAAYGDAIREASLRFGVPREIILAVIWRESRGKVDSVRREPHLGDASYGLMQILCSTARDVGFRGKCEELLNPEINIHFGTAYLAWLRNHGAPTWPLAIAAYNCGIGRVKRIAAVVGYNPKAIYNHLPKITRSYLKEIFGPELDGKGGTLEIARRVVAE